MGRLIRHRKTSTKVVKKGYKIASGNKYKYQIFEWEPYTKNNGTTGIKPIDAHRFLNKPAANNAARIIRLEHHHQATIKPYEGDKSYSTLKYMATH